MKHDDFFQRLTELAEWQLPKEKGVSPAQRNRIKNMIQRLEDLRDTDEWEDDFDDKLEDLRQMLKPQRNYTLPIELVKVKSLTPCDDCGRINAEGRKVQSKMLWTPKPHWRHSCNICHRTKHPDTGEFTINNKSIRSFFAEYFSRKTK